MAQFPRADRCLADAEGPELLGTPLSLKNMLDQAVSLDPEREAMISMHQSSIARTPPNGPKDSLRPPLRYTFGRLQHEATSLAVALYTHGVRPGQPVVAFLYNCAEFAIALWAAARLIVPYVPLDPKRVSNQSEVEHCLRKIKPAVLLADNSLIDVLQRNLSPDLSHSTLRIVTSAAGSSTMGWLPLSEILHEKDPMQTASTLAVIDEISINIDSDVAFVVFTSGTSGLPKACPHTNRTLWASYMGSRWLRQILPEHKLLQHLPPSHVFGYVNMLASWAAGASVVFPSKSFDAKDSLDTLEAEQCTHTSAVPTMIKALVSHPEFSSQRAKSLVHISLGGTIISQEVIRICQDTTGSGLGVKYAKPGFGMSEGIPTLGWHLSTEPMIEDGLASVGQPVPGARVRICKVGSHECVPYNEVGELHVGGPAIISDYISSENSSFYDSDACHWMTTGDQARMNESGAVFILGRYKDIIIRAGENLAPYKIEACISKMFPSITSQVVGVPDEIVGEAPAAVLHLPDGLVPDTMRIKAAVVENLGLAYAPEIIVNLRDIGLETFPITASGKVKKHELRNLLLQHVKRRNLNSRMLTDTAISTEGALVDVLSLFLGQSPADLPREKAVTELLDSISIMRFLDEIGKRLHKNVGMKDVRKASSVTALAKIIDSDGEPEEISMAGPPEISRMTDESDDQSLRIQHQVQPTLEKLGLTWADDVQDVYPMAGTASFYWSRGIPFSHQLTYLTKISQKHRLRSIIESSLKAWPTFRSLCAEYDPATHLWVVLKHNTKFLDIAISEHPDVEDLTELATLSIPPRHIVGQFPDGLLFHAAVANVKSTGTAGFVMLANHTAYDLLSMTYWRRDLELLLRGEPAIQRPPFKLFADTYYLYQNSLPAQHSTAFHLRLLKGLSGLRQALWPLHGTPFSLPSSATSNQPAVDSKTSQTPISIRNGDLAHHLRVPAISTIASHHGISAPVLVRTAIALFNTLQTGHSHAIFFMLMAGRAWPFLSPEIANALPNPLNIAGPTFSAVTSVLKIDPEETVEGLLRRVAEQQKQLNKHQHIPISMQAQLNEGDREVWMEAKRQFCNWTPGKWGGDREQESGLELVKIDGYEGHDFKGYIWECGMSDKETVRVRAQWNRTVFGEEEVEGFLVVVMRIIGLLGQVEQWGKSVGEVRDAARSAASS